jgi:hypothetical protein
MASFLTALNAAMGISELSTITQWAPVFVLPSTACTYYSAGCLSCNSSRCLSCNEMYNYSATQFRCLPLYTSCNSTIANCEACDATGQICMMCKYKYTLADNKCVGMIIIRLHCWLRILLEFFLLELPSSSELRPLADRVPVLLRLSYKFEQNRVCSLQKQIHYLRPMQ